MNKVSWRRVGIMLGVVVWSTAQVATAQPATPDTTDAVVWGDDPGAAGDAVSKPVIPVRNAQDLILPPAASPTILIGNAVWDRTTGRETGITLAGAARKNELAYERNRPHAISPDGKLFAAFPKDGPKNTVRVWSLETGQQVCDFVHPNAEKATLPWLEFADNGRLLIGQADPRALISCDLESRQMVPVALPDRTRLERMTLSPDGRYVAVVAHDHVYVVDTRTGRRAATMTNPTTADPAAGKAPAARGAGRRAAARGPDVDAIFLLAWTKALAFRPDGRELVGIFSHQYPRMIIWNTAGKIVADERLPSVLSGADEGISWRPDGSGFLLSERYLYDRGHKMIVWIPDLIRLGDRPRAHFVDNDHVGAIIGNEYRVLKIPQERINASLKAMASNAPAILRPGGEIKLEVKNDAGSDVPDARTVIAERLQAVLGVYDIKITDTATTVLTVKITETRGDPLKIVEKSSPWDRQGTDTGRTMRVYSAKGTAELRAPGRAEPVWSYDVQATSSTSYTGEITDATVRESMLKGLASQVVDVGWPGYIPADENLSWLPVVGE